MTLQQLQYVVTVAETGTITEAAEKLFITQPSLTNAIRELEKEMNINIFLRSNKGVVVSKEGEVFLGYARQVLEQAALLKMKYAEGREWSKNFCVSTQHYSFAVNAFVDLIKKYGGEEYDYNLRETQTYEIIEDVALMKSEIGILYINETNSVILNKALREKELELEIQGKTIGEILSEDTNKEINNWLDFILTMADEQLYYSKSRLEDLVVKRVNNEPPDEYTLKKIKQMKISRLK